MTFGAVISGLTWELCCRVLPLALAGVVVLVGVVGWLWLIGRVARALGSKGGAGRAAVLQGRG